MSRDWLLCLDDLIASAEKIGRLIGGRELAAVLQADARQLQRDCAG
ncbi:MAG: hypothetical protein HYZ20_06990 [Burkholderiales bacterium]|nr:hypothetical protein [Burkholderiales bacterium]